MSKRTWLCYLGAVLLVSAAPAVAGAKKPAPQSSASTTKKSAGKKTVKSKRKAKPRVVGQQAPTVDRIREIQSALTSKGALSGEPTGKWDSATVSALQRFQTDNGLGPTGKIDALTLQKLGLGSEIAGKAPPTSPTVPAASGPPNSPSSSSVSP